MSDYKITLDDGTVIEAPTKEECLELAEELKEPSAIDRYERIVTGDVTR